MIQILSFAALCQAVAQEGAERGREDVRRAASRMGGDVQIRIAQPLGGSERIVEQHLVLDAWLSPRAP
jgi:hypothetical protein